MRIHLSTETENDAESNESVASSSEEEHEYEMNFDSPDKNANDPQRMRRIALDLKQIRECNFAYTGYTESMFSTFVYCSISVAQLVCASLILFFLSQLERRLQTHLFLDAFHVKVEDYVILILVS